ncbi:MAG: Crp/Fnr family transcriptional regulator [Micavibrio sp.]|nr:Crp/Fnr family transcriptional regulator [Micavibrio sp.]|tara:strand:+ start:358 stop:1077 length:720 start_codon:yes stop_codon:yes gene_type:complete
MLKNTLCNIGLFKDCGDSFFTNLAAGAKSHKYNKGKILFLHGDKGDNFFYVQSGWVKLFRETLDGTQAVVDIFTTGHIFGDTAIFEDGIYPYSAEIVESSEIITLPIAPLKEEIANNSKFAFSMLGSMAKYRRQQDREIEHRSIQNASQRIGCFLLRLLQQNEDGQVQIHLPYDKMLVASRLGMQPETFSRALKKLQNETGIRVKGSTITMDDCNQLVRYSCAACTSEFPCKDISSAAE